MTEIDNKTAALNGIQWKILTLYNVCFETNLKKDSLVCVQITISATNSLKKIC